ncbi:hypothetical protein MRX96_002070 [Rhipicephalus microplus]
MSRELERQFCSNGADDALPITNKKSAGVRVLCELCASLVRWLVLLHAVVRGTWQAPPVSARGARGSSRQSRPPLGSTMPALLVPR